MRKLRRSGLAEAVGGFHNDLFFDACWPDERLAGFLRAAAARGTFDLNPWMTFTAADVSAADFLRPRPRKVVADTTADFERMRSEFDELPWVGSDPKRRFRLPTRLSLSKISLRPNQVGAVGQWTAEYVVPSLVRNLIEDAGLSGIEFRPVYHTRTGRPYDHYFHLYSGHTLGDRILDIASPEIPSSRDDEQGYDAMGCYCYDGETLAQAQDFNRSGERNVSFEFPDWIVRAPVRQLFAEHGLKGWAFEPVLLRGSPAGETYNDLWSSFYELLAECKAHTVRNRAIPSH